jgi:hypothetical protein
MVIPSLVIAYEIYTDVAYLYLDLNVALSSTVSAPTVFSTFSSAATTTSDTPRATAATSSSKVSDEVIGRLANKQAAFKRLA